MADDTVNVGLGMGEPENVPQIQLGAAPEQDVPAIELNIEVPDTVYAKRSEAWAIGTMGGVPVSSGDPTYHNNSKYYSEQSRDAALQAVADAKASGEFDGEKGDPGKDFHIAKTFSSIAAMMAYTGTDIEENDFAMIDTGSVQDVDTGKLYCYEPTKTPKWSYIGDLSGAQGIKGETGTGIDSITLNQDYTLTISLDDGTSYTTASIRGATGANAYVHIRYSTNQPTQDSDMHTTPDDWMGVYSGTSSTAPTTYTSYAWSKIKGEQGSASNVYGNTIPMSSTDSIKVSEAIATKLNSNQGAGNAGKALGIDSTGAVVPVPFSGDDFTGATASTDGVHGYVPAPLAGEQGKFLKGDGTWGEVADPDVFTGATASANGTTGLVPAPSAGDQSKVLTGGGTWAVSPGAKVCAKTVTVTNTSGAYSQTFVDENITSDMKAVELEVSRDYVFGDLITVTPGNGSFTVSCNSVTGTDTITISFIKVIADPTAITTTEFDILSNRIGSLTSLTTTDKTNVVSAVNEVNARVADAEDDIADNATAIASNTQAIGTLSSLHTTAKTNLVSAINETYSMPCKATIKNVNCSKSAESLVSSVFASNDPVGKIYTGTWTVPGVDAGRYVLLKTSATGEAFGVASFGATTAYVIRNATSWIQV